jgi:hypothetical protein
VTFRGHNASVEQVTFAPDRLGLITAHGDGTVRRWQCEVCGPIGGVRQQADTRTTRDLTPNEHDAFATNRG